MRLIDDFFHITESCVIDSENIKCSVSLNESHVIYKAHFIGNPITPGVCVVQMAAEILGHFTGKDLVMRRAKSIKFKRAISPTSRPVFTFSKIARDGDNVRASVSVDDESGQFVKMVGVEFESSVA